MCKLLNGSQGQHGVPVRVTLVGQRLLNMCGPRQAREVAPAVLVRIGVCGFLVNVSGVVGLHHVIIVQVERIQTTNQFSVRILPFTDDQRTATMQHTRAFAKRKEPRRSGVLNRSEHYLRIRDSRTYPY